MLLLECYFILFLPFFSFLFCLQHRPKTCPSTPHPPRAHSHTRGALTKDKNNKYDKYDHLGCCCSLLPVINENLIPSFLPFPPHVTKAWRVRTCPLCPPPKTDADADAITRRAERRGNDNPKRKAARAPALAAVRSIALLRFA